MCRLDQLQTAHKAQDFLHLEHSVRTTQNMIPLLSTLLPVKKPIQTPAKSLNQTPTRTQTI